MFRRTTRAGAATPEPPDRPGFSVSNRLAQILVPEPEGIALRREDLGVVDEPADHRRPRSPRHRISQPRSENGLFKVTISDARFWRALTGPKGSCHLRPTCSGDLERARLLCRPRAIQGGIREASNQIRPTPTCGSGANERQLALYRRWERCRRGRSRRAEPPSDSTAHTGWMPPFRA